MYWSQRSDEVQSGTRLRDTDEIVVVVVYLVYEVSIGFSLIRRR